jgi:hypothetical protein
MTKKRNSQRPAKAHCILRQDRVFLFVLHSIDKRAPFYLSKLSSVYDKAVRGQKLGRAAIDALDAARYLPPSRRNFVDGVERMRGKQTATAFYRGVGFVSLTRGSGDIVLLGMERNGRWHVGVRKLKRSFSIDIDDKTLGEALYKLLRASQRINTPAVGWDSKRGRPL